MADLKETLPFSFSEIYDGIAAKFAEKGYDSPYDGSNLAQLITSMAYTTSMLNANTAVNINEMILTLAQKRPNIIQDARMLGYESAKKVSYVYDLLLKFKENKVYTISKYSEFTANGLTYYYTGEDIDIDLTNEDISTFTYKIRVKEGTLHLYENEPENLRQIVANLQYFDIPFTDVETDGIEVFVTYYTQEGILSTKSKFAKSETLLLDKDDNLTKKFVRIEDDEMATPRIYFVLSGVGFAIPKGAIVEFNILISKGPDGEMTTDPICSRSDIEVIANSKTLIIKGAVEESNDSIKENAPLLHNTASRAVVANDYEVICKKHPACQEAFIFGGEDEKPKRLGNIFLSMTPKKASRNFSYGDDKTYFELQDLENIENNFLLDEDLVSNTVDSEGNLTNNGIIDNIRILNLPALEYNIRNPIYILMDFDITIVKYALASVKNEVRFALFNLLNDYILNKEKYETEFFKSHIINFMDDYLTEIAGLGLNTSFKIMLNAKTINYEDIPFTCTYVDKNINPYLSNPGFEHPKEYSISIYLDTPYEGLYDNDKFLVLEHLPSIDTDNFIGSDKLWVDTTSYIKDINTKDTKRSEINFNIMLGTKIIGVYSVFNDRTTYIRVKIYCKKVTDTYTIPGFDPLDKDLFNTTRYINLQYPTENMKTLRNSIFKLNTVKIK